MTIRIGMLLFPKITQLDLTGPYEVLARVPRSRDFTLLAPRGNHSSPSLPAPG